MQARATLDVGPASRMAEHKLTKQGSGFVSELASTQVPSRHATSTSTRLSIRSLTATWEMRPALSISGTAAAAALAGSLAVGHVAEDCADDLLEDALAWPEESGAAADTGAARQDRAGHGSDGETDGRGGFFAGGHLPFSALNLDEEGGDGFGEFPDEAGEVRDDDFDEARESGRLWMPPSIRSRRISAEYLRGLGLPGPEDHEWSEGQKAASAARGSAEKLQASGPCGSKRSTFIVRLEGAVRRRCGSKARLVSRAPPAAAAAEVEGAHEAGAQELTAAAWQSGGQREPTMAGAVSLALLRQRQLHDDGDSG